MREQLQKLPAAGPKREALREKGQFWTPAWIAEAMVAYVVGRKTSHIFDPAVGAGAFFRAAKARGEERGSDLTLLGTEIDRASLELALESGLSERDLSRVVIGNFVLDPPKETFQAIVANPPYILHHRLPPALKQELRHLGFQVIGARLDGRAGLHVYFLIRALQLLKKKGRLAFIMPADTCEGVFSQPLWKWITQHYCLEAVISFRSNATPFPGVDTNPLIFLICNRPPKDSIWWVRCLQPETVRLKSWIASNFSLRGTDDLAICKRTVAEALETGLSREPLKRGHAGPVLGHFASVLRGIATGANDFFFMTQSRAAQLGIPDEFLVTAVGRTRDVEGFEITYAHLEQLERAGRPTRLLSLAASPLKAFPERLRTYLEHGEQIGLPKRPLIATRSPWYKMETRAVPPYLFAYLGRRSARFICNRAGVVPLTGFLCVYPHQCDDPEYTEKLWRVLTNPRTIENLRFVGKSYGSGAIKVEPRALERLPIPIAALQEVGLDLPERRQEQFAFLFERPSHVINLDEHA